MSYSTLFLDVGGVLLTNGWDRPLRNKAAEHFGLDPAEMQSRHEMVFEDYERGLMTLDEYLYHVIFYKPRNFAAAEFKDFIFNAARADEQMIGMAKALKSRFNLKVAVLSNEGQEISVNRFNKFNFQSFIDYYIVSGFTGVRKPDLRIYELAIGLCQAPPSKIIYIDDRLSLVEIAQSFGLCAIHHTGYASTRKALQEVLGDTQFES